MKNVSEVKRSEIAFLNAHPLGPRMTPSKISEYLDISKSTVHTICAENTVDTAEAPPQKYLTRRRTAKAKTQHIHDDCTWQFVCLILALILFICSVLYSSSIRINKEKWMQACKYDFYDDLETKLDITKDDVKELHIKIDGLYSLGKFTEPNHQTLLKCIERQVTLKKQLERVVHQYNYQNRWKEQQTYSTNVYSKAQSIKMLLIIIDELHEKFE